MTGRHHPLAFVFVAAAFLAAATASQAEEEVGLEAQGVSAWYALNNRLGLDVRDELGRPVTARKIESELKSASAQAAGEAAYASRLPQARAVAVAMELLPALEAFVFLPPIPHLPLRVVWGLPAAARPGAKLFALVACFLAFAALMRPRALGPGSIDLSCASRAPLILRC